MQLSLYEWLLPILHAVQDEHSDRFSGTPAMGFVLVAERRLHITVDSSRGPRGATESLISLMDADSELFLRVLELAIEHVDMGYSFQAQAQALARLDQILTEAGSVWRLDIQRVDAGEGWHGRPAYREIRTLQRRTAVETASALQAISRDAPDVARHLATAWNHALGRNSDPGRAYSEAIKAVEAAAIPIVSPNDPKPTLGTEIGQLRATPDKWQVIVTRGVKLGGAGAVSPMEVITGMVALLLAKHTDRHAPIEPVSQAQAELAVHLALTLSHVFMHSVRRMS